MAYCCVPRCKSDEKRKTAGLSFHEIPADSDLREKWLAKIHRDCWTPNTTSCYTKVCSRHFKDDDFIQGKRRRLRKGAVPSVFEDFPLHLQPKPKNERSTASIQKRDCSSGKRATNAATVAPGLLPSSTRAPSLPDAADCTPINIDTGDSASALGQLAPEPQHAQCDEGVQVDNRPRSSLLVAERAKWKRKERDLRSQILRLKQTVDKYKLELKKIHEDPITAAISYIRREAEHKQPSALFLPEQIQNFRKKRPSWSEETVQSTVFFDICLRRHTSTCEGKNF